MGTPLQACAHTFFDELREPGTKLPNGRDLPPLFNFTDSELKIQPTLNSQLIPSHLASQTANSQSVAAAAADSGAAAAAASTNISSDAADASTASAMAEGNGGSG